MFKNVVLCLNDRSAKSEELKARLKESEDKSRRLFLWAVTGATISYLNFVVAIAGFYLSLQGKHIILLVIGMMVVFMLMGTIIFDAWKITPLLPRHFSLNSHTLLRFYIDKLNVQRKLVAGFLMKYTLLVITAGVFFAADIRHGLALLFKFTTPVSFISYILGIYFIGNCTRKIKKLSLAGEHFKDSGTYKGFNLN